MPMAVDDIALGDDLSRALSEIHSPVSARLLSPELDLDSASLPPLDDFSNVEDALSGSLGDLADLGPLPSLEPLTVHLPVLSHTLSPAMSPHPPAVSDSSVSSHSLTSPSRRTPATCCADVRAALHELSARLKSATAETASLRGRVAELVRENRQLRTSLDTAKSANPLLLGLAHVSAEAASSLAAALAPRNVAQQQPVGKKRKRAAAGKTLACLVLMCGFFFGTPSVLDPDRTDAVAVWGGASNNAIATRPVAPPVRPSHCLRTLEQLAPPEPAVVAPPPALEDNQLVVSPPASKEERHKPAQFGYVMCRNSSAALEHVSECQRKQSVGKKCGAPHSISLIMPAAALSDSLHDDDDDDVYAEVLCNVVSVSRIPAAEGAGSRTANSDAGSPRKQRKVSRGAAMSGVAAVHAALGTPPRLGRVIGSVHEEVVGT